TLEGKRTAIPARPKGGTGTGRLRRPRGLWFFVDQLLNILRQEIELQVHARAEGKIMQGGVLPRVRHDPDGKAAGFHGGHGGADPVDGDAAFRREPAVPFLWNRNGQLPVPVSPPLPTCHSSRAVDVARDEMAAQPSVGPQRPLQVDAVAGFAISKVRT